VGDLFIIKQIWVRFYIWLLGYKYKEFLMAWTYANKTVKLLRAIEQDLEM
jgi:hypothetical protein